MSNERPKIVCVIGSTGTGKSAFALELAARISGEIINADAMQVCLAFIVLLFFAVP